MQIIDTVAAMRDWSRQQQSRTTTIALVPTMGALHEGHLSLIAAARAAAQAVVVSIFVNPTQFDDPGDLEAYPVTREADLEACRAAGADAVFIPSVEDMYPRGCATFVEVFGPLSDKLCGAVRPGHFRGVCTVVCKLFNIVQPEVAVFGAKDLQQLLIIQRMVEDLLLPIRLEVCPTVREDDGVAMSSRNAHLSPEGRRKARSLIVGLEAARQAFTDGERASMRLIEVCASEILQYPDVDLDYAEVVDLAGFEDRTEAHAGCILALAAFVDGVRLIDHIHLGGAAVNTRDAD